MVQLQKDSGQNQNLATDAEPQRLLQQLDAAFTTARWDPWTESRPPIEDPALADQREWITSRLHVGLPFQFRAMLKPRILSRHLGIGFVFYGNLNFKRSFAVGGSFISLGSF